MAKIKDDEFYTRYEDIEKIMKRYDLKGLKIYCPCDTENSNFVKYFKDHNYTFKHTSDDYYKHEDLYEWCDVIVTNPPFSGFSAWACWMLDKHKKFLIVTPVFSLSTSKYNKRIAQRESFIDIDIRKFTRPDGTIRDIPCVWTTNLELKC